MEEEEEKKIMIENFKFWKFDLIAQKVKKEWEPIAEPILQKKVFFLKKKFGGEKFLEQKNDFVFSYLILKSV